MNGVSEGADGGGRATKRIVGISYCSRARRKEGVEIINDRRSLSVSVLTEPEVHFFFRVVRPVSRLTSDSPPDPLPVTGVGIPRIPTFH